MCPSKQSKNNRQHFDFPHINIWKTEENNMLLPPLVKFVQGIIIKDISQTLLD